MNALKANKFKVGDVVEIVSLQGTDGVGCRGDCYVGIGETGVVTEVSEGDMPYEVETNGETWAWSENNLKLVNEETNTSQNESIDPFFESDVILPKNDEDDFTCCLGKSIESKTYNPLVAQEGGGHYKNRGIQPIEYSHANSLSASQHSVVKYITRYYDKGGIEDLSKIVHFVLLEAYFRYGEQGSTELKDKILTILGENKES